MDRRAFVRLDDGTERDITEAIKAMYDLVIDSMDWGSQFLSFEDALPVGQIAQLMDFDKAAEVARYLNSESAIRRNYNWELPEHEHLFLEGPRCIWPKCEVEK